MKSGFVSIIGRPNSGKSTLLNRLVGDKISIVTDKPQTTRNVIRGIVTHTDGQVVFLDTPGIHKPIHKMNERMMKFVRESMAEIEPATGTVVHAFTTGTMVQVFQLAPNQPIDAVTHTNATELDERADDDGMRVAPEDDFHAGSAPPTGLRQLGAPPDSEEITDEKRGLRCWS